MLHKYIFENYILPLVFFFCSVLDVIYGLKIKYWALSQNDILIHNYVFDVFQNLYLYELIDMKCICSDLGTDLLMIVFYFLTRTRRAYLEINFCICMFIYILYYLDKLKFTYSRISIQCYTDVFFFVI